ncbi:hypothetical protein T01_767 [Trichinella spiralis]|uniref:Uncharacterized protein n=1 Tax=Trichinella spiralis TaxID=6334 RepID=A0A0V1BJM2_TRISP|nr:hypothetical protein T01_767 [Trichinella spiralis]
MHSDQPTIMCSDYWSSIIWKTIRLNVMHINKLAMQTVMMPFIQVRSVLRNMIQKCILQQSKSHRRFQKAFYQNKADFAEAFRNEAVQFIFIKNTSNL